MKDRALTLLLAAGAFLAFYYFFVGPTGPPRDESSRPLSAETRPNGYLGARRWMESHGIEVVELRHRFDWLQREESLPASGNLLITTIPFSRAARAWEFDSLGGWIAQGNTVLVAAGLFDTPEWAIPERDTFRDLHGVSGLGFRSPPEPEPETPAESEAAKAAGDREAPTPAEQAAAALAAVKRLDQPQRGALVPAGAHPLTAGVERVEAISEYPAGKFEGVTPADAAMLALMRDEESGVGGLWLTWLGNGTVVVSGYGSIFTNKLLGEADNARLLANVIALHLAPGGRVIFDDIHQGAASFYDAEAFFADPRLHATLWWIFGLWLLWVLGGTRLPMPAAGPATVREQTFLTAIGNFFARTLDRRRVAARLFENFFAELHGEAVAAGDPWRRIRGVATVEPALLARVEAAHRRLAAGRRVDLVDLHNHLRQLRKQLQ